MNDRILAERRARGWSQAELARRAGLTRQLVGAVEAGRHVPGVEAALALARALGSSVEALFATTTTAVLPVLDEAVAPGAPVEIGRVGAQLVAVPGPVVADATVTASGLDWLPGGTPADLVVAGCDPVLDLAAGLLARAGTRLLPVHASTGRSVAALAAGRVHGAVVHARAGDLPTPPVPVRRWHVARWQVGLAAIGAVPGVDELAARRPVVVQRDAGAGTQQALVRALHAVGSDVDLPGPLGNDHLDVARRVSYGVGVAGVVMESAARSLGLGFTPLEEHVVELWLAEEWASTPAATAFLDTLASAHLLSRVRLLPGYDPSDCGTLRVG